MHRIQDRPQQDVVLVCAEHPDIRRALARSLRVARPARTVRPLSGYRPAIAACADEPVEQVLFALHGLGGDHGALQGITATIDLLRIRHPRLSLVAVASPPLPSPETVAGLLVAGVDALLRWPLAAPPDPEPALSRKQRQAIGGPPVELSVRQRQLLHALAEGSTYNRIAANLGIAASSVHTDLHLLYRKLGVANSTQAIAVAFRTGLL